MNLIQEWWCSLLFPTLWGATSLDMVSTVFFVPLPTQSAVRTDTESCLEISRLYDILWCCSLKTAIHPIYPCLKFQDPAGIWTQTFWILYSIICLTDANVWESMGKPCSCMQFIKSRNFYYKSHKNPHQYYKSRENPYQYYKSRALHLNVQWGSYDKIIINIVPSYTGKKNIYVFVAIGIATCAAHS